MSLLMKALQKAEKSGSEISLEPLPSADPAGEAASPPRSPAQQQAATVFEAAAPATRRLPIVGITAVALGLLAALAGGAYVYYATQPTSLVPSHPPPRAPLAQAPPAAPLESPPSAAQPPAAPAVTAPAVTAPAVTAPAVAAPAAPAAEAPPPAEPPPVAAAEPGAGGEAPPAPGTVLAAAAATQPPARPRPARAAPAKRPAAATPKAVAQPAPEESTVITAEAGDSINVSRAPRELTLNASAAAGYAAFEAGRFAEAEAAYRRALDEEPQNTDAMLGLAASLVRLGRADEASREYMRVLQVDPRNPVAQTGLIAILGGLNPEGSEERLRVLAAGGAGPFVNFALGNLYAAQGRWDRARDQFAEAVRGQPANAEYAYNLAVSLDHLGQRRPALEQYRRALDLVAASPASAIDPKRLSTRIAELERTPE